MGLCLVRALFSCLLLALLSGCEFFYEFGFLERPKSKLDSYVIFISMDGYRHDFTKRFAPPNIMAIEKAGVSAESLIPVFPPDTFPAHYSMATGMYPDKTGIVANNFYDREINREYRKAREQDVRDGSWYRGVPFWAAAEKQGVVAASLFWPGSEAEISGKRPTYFFYHDPEMPNTRRVNQVRTWLELPSQIRPHMINMYFSTIDDAAHRYGTKSKQVRDAVYEVDTAIGLLMKHGKALGLPIHYVIASSHGIIDLREDRQEFIGDYIDLTGLRIIGEFAKYSIYIDDPMKREKIYAQLKAKAKHFRVYRRDEVPERLHCSNPRSGDIILLAEAPYNLGRTRQIMRTARTYRFDKARHGFDPYTVYEMHGAFFAMGPKIQQGVKIPTFESVHIYPFLMKLLGIKVLGEVDGQMRILQGILNE